MIPVEKKVLILYCNNYLLPQEPSMRLDVTCPEDLVFSCPIQYWNGPSFCSLFLICINYNVC